MTDDPLVIGAPDAPALFDSAKSISLALPFSEFNHYRPQRRVVLGTLADQLSMVELRRFLHRACYLLQPEGELEIHARAPESVETRFSRTPWPGEEVPGTSPVERYRPLRQYLELLRLFPCRLTRLTATSESLEIRAQENRGRHALYLPEDNTGHELDSSHLDTKYGPGSEYRRFRRLEEPEILDDLLYGISRIRPRSTDRLLSLGVNDGAELELLQEVTGQTPELWGVDGAKEALAAARARFPSKRHRWIEADLNSIDTHGFPQFDILLALNVFQCTTVDRDRIVSTVKSLVTPNSRILFSLPNCHFGPDDILRRPLDRSDPRHNRWLMLKDLRYVARTFYRFGFRRIEQFGTYDSFLLIR